jgi:phosphatidylinositol glycan class B
LRLLNLALPADDRTFVRRVVLVALAFHLAAAWFSVGFYQFDEHFQILELMGAKLGRTPESLRPYEYLTGMRPFVEILPMYGIARVFEAIFGVRPIALERIFRLVTACGGLAVAIGLAARQSRELLSPFARRAAWLAQLLFWPIVFVHARISAEAVGSTLFWAGWLALGNGVSSRRSLSAGLLLGLAFMARFQLGFALAGLGLWLLVARVPLGQILRLAFGFFVGVGLGVLCDRWGYGRWVFTPWNYFKENILKGMAAHFGVEPWWWYFKEASLVLIPGFGVLLLGAAGWYLLTRPKHALSLAMALFIAGHCAVGHKELRFLIPALPFVAWVAVAAVDALATSRLARALAWSYGAISAVALPAMVLRPANLPQIYFNYVDAHYRHGYDVVYDGRWPISLGPVEIYYYRPTPYRERKIESLAELLPLTTKEGKVLYFREGLELPSTLPSQVRCELLVKTVPWYLDHPKLMGLIDKQAMWSLWECQRTTS